MELSIIIPAYNEEKKLRNSLPLISGYLKGKYKDYEIIVVNDGSTDRTAGLLEEVADQILRLRVMSNDKNMGKGYSVKKGMLAAKGTKILFSDADLSTPIDQLDKLEKALGSYDIAIASRALKDSLILKKQNILREYMGKVFNLLVRMVLMNGVKDTQCGFKLFKKKCAFDLFSKQKIAGFAFDAEILYMARKMGYKIKSVPVTWYNSPDSSVKLLSSSLNMFLELLKIRGLHRDL